MPAGTKGPAPLSSIRVVELARILAGPWAGQLLADLGAEVIKVESPAGDDTRAWGPPFVTYSDGSQDAAYFHAANRGKQSITADFTDVQQRAEVVDLIREADVVIENFRVGGLATFGLDYASLNRINPRLIYCSITGFGQDGPYAARPGYDLLIQGLSGIMDLTGEPGGAPQKIGVAFADIMAGLYAANGIQAALIQRERTGRGQLVDISLFDVMVGSLANQAMNFLTSGECPARLGNAHPNIVPYQAFACADGWVIVAVGNDAQFARFARLLGLPENAQWRTNRQRVVDRAALADALAERIASWSRDDLLQAMLRETIPGGPINTVEQAFADPQIIDRGMQLSMTGDDGTAISGVRSPLVFSDAGLALGKPSPRLGQKIGT